MLYVSYQRMGWIAVGMLLMSIVTLDTSTSLHRVIGSLASELGSTDTAERHFRIAVTASRRKAAETLANDLLRIGRHYRETGRLQASRGALEEAIGLYPEDLSFDRRRRSRILLNLIDVYQDLGLLEDALDAGHRLLRLAEDRLGESHALIAGVLDSLVTIQAQRGDLQAAEELRRRALLIRESNFGSEHPEVANTMTRLGRILADRGDARRARLYLERSVSLLRSVNMPDRVERAMLLFAALNELGLVLQQEGKIHEAWTTYRDALELPVNAAPDRVALLLNASNALLELGRTNDALRFSEVALELEDELEVPEPLRESMSAAAERARLDAMKSLESSADVGPSVARVP